MTAVEQPMATKPVLPLLITMAVPPMVSMLVQSLYNIVDSIFVARLGQDALTAVSLAFPLQNLVLAVAVGLGVGLNGAIARNLGLQNQEQVDSAASHGMVLTAIHAVFFLLFGLFAIQPFFRLFTPEGEIFRQGCTYGAIVICFSFGSLFHITIEKMFQAQGNMILPMVMQGVGAVVNLVLDPILIFGLLGAPALGVAGAAIATVIGQITACGLSVWLLRRHPGNIRLRFRGFRFQWAMVRQLYGVAIPSAVMMALPSVLIGLLNHLLYAVSQTAVALLGIYFKVQTFVYMPANGLIQGMRPILSYNYGAGRLDRLHQTLRWALWITGGIMALGTLLFWLLPRAILGMFQATPELLAIGIPALRWISLGFLASGVGIILAGAFEAFGYGGSSLLISLLRQLLVILPLSWLLLAPLDLTGVWLSFPVAELVAAVVGSLLFYRCLRKMTGTTRPGRLG